MKGLITFFVMALIFTTLNSPNVSAARNHSELEAERALREVMDQLDDLEARELQLDLTQAERDSIAEIKPELEREYALRRFEYATLRAKTDSVKSHCRMYRAGVEELTRQGREHIIPAWEEVIGRTNYLSGSSLSACK